MIVCVCVLNDVIDCRHPSITGRHSSANSRHWSVQTGEVGGVRRRPERCFVQGPDLRLYSEGRHPAEPRGRPVGADEVRSDDH